MPLTIDETIAAICALDTEKDIIFRACERLTRPPRQETGSYEIAIQIMTKYRGEPTHDVIYGFAIALGRYAAVNCVHGKEAEMIKNVSAMFVEEFRSGLLSRFKVMYEQDPSKAVEALIATARAIVSATKGET